MSEEDSVMPNASAAQSTEPSPERADVAMVESKSEVAESGSNGTEGSHSVAAKPDTGVSEEEKDVTAEASLPPPNQDTEATEQKPSMSSDGETKDGDNAANADADAGSAEGAEGAADSTSKSKSRRKSGVPEHRGKKLNRKASTLKQLHLDAKPGDYFLVKLKGYPTWPAVICDEDMLPQALLSTRPQTAARMDGSYREEYADGGKRVKERTYAVMFMATNEFAWTPNTDLREFDIEESRNFPPSRTKNLTQAHQLAVEQHPLSHWKEVLNDFQASVQQALDEEQARMLAKEEKEKKKSAKKSAKTVEEGDVADDGDEDISLGLDVEGEGKKKKSTKKRELAEGEGKTGTPATKKLKLTLSKSTNGTPASAKPKSEKKGSAAKPKKKEAAAEPPKPVEPELTPEEQRLKKEREILFLRHKLQKGLLNRDAPPEESQMAQMAEYINKLEGYPDLEVSIIKVTKINKVLKAILKLDAIPKESEFNFKARSSQLLSKWNHILDNAPKEPPAIAAPAAPAEVNGLTNGDVKSEHGEKQDSGVKEASNGTNGIKAEAVKTDEDVEMKDEVAAAPDTVMADVAKDEADVAASAPEEAKDTDIPDAAPAVEATS